MCLLKWCLLPPLQPCQGDKSYWSHGLESLLRWWLVPHQSTHISRHIWDVFENFEWYGFFSKIGCPHLHDLSRALVWCLPHVHCLDNGLLLKWFLCQSMSRCILLRNYDASWAPIWQPMATEKKHLFKSNLVNKISAKSDLHLGWWQLLPQKHVCFQKARIVHMLLRIVVILIRQLKVVRI